MYGCKANTGTGLTVPVAVTFVQDSGRWGVLSGAVLCTRTSSFKKVNPTVFLLFRKILHSITLKHQFIFLLLHGRMAGFTVSAILKFTPLSGAHNEEPLCYLLEVTCALSWLHSFHFCISLSQPHSLSLHLYAVMYMSTPNTFSHRLTCRVCLCSLTCSRAAASFKIQIVTLHNTRQ